MTKTTGRNDYNPDYACKKDCVANEVMKEWLNTGKVEKMIELSRRIEKGEVVVVPVEPTEEQYDVGDIYTKKAFAKGHPVFAEEMYKAMIEAGKVDV